MQLRTLRRLTGLILGMLVLFTGCRPNMKPFQVVSAIPKDSPALAETGGTVSSIPAFPGAEGFGAESVGGRGGRVIEVINLDDGGPGTLRACVETGEPRICIFRIGGTIELRSELVITNPYITIAGQTAPGGGITLKSASSYNNSTLQIKTHDVIVRYIRLRTGPTDALSNSRDGIVFAYNTPYNVIIDHCSISWAVDENVTFWFDPHDITIQWCIISEGLRDSSHEKGPHSMGMLVGSDGAENISVHHNLFVHNNGRNPMVNTSGIVDVVNNVVYNSGQESAFIGDSYAKGVGNFVSNYYKRGADSNTHHYLDIGAIEGEGFDVYLQGNITPRRPMDYLPDHLVVEPEDREWIVQTRHDAPLVTTTSAFEAYEQVLTNAGATLPKRDAVDERIVNDVINGTGRIIEDPSDVGGWPQLPAGTAPADTDHDGMPDQWENTWGFDPCNSSDGPGDADGDGYTNVEEYLNGTDSGSGSATNSCLYFYLSLPIVVK